MANLLLLIGGAPGGDAAARGCTRPTCRSCLRVHMANLLLLIGGAPGGDAAA